MKVLVALMIMSATTFINAENYLTIIAERDDAKHVQGGQTTTIKGTGWVIDGFKFHDIGRFNETTQEMFECFTDRHCCGWTDIFVRLPSKEVLAG